MHTDPQPSHNTKNAPQPISTDTTSKKLICQVRLWPGVRSRAFLGEYDESELKGFMVELTPEPAVDKLLTLEIIKLPAGPKWKLLLHAANKGQVTIVAKVWQL